MARWYERVLGAKVLAIRGRDTASPCAAFIRLPDGGPILELFRIASVSPLSSLVSNPLELHLAFETDDPAEEADRLVQCGATFVDHGSPRPPGDELQLLYDPWHPWRQRHGHSGIPGL